MKLKYKKVSVVLAIMAAVNISPISFTKVHAATDSIAAIQTNTDEKVIVQKATTNTNKAWTVTFNSEVDYNEIKNVLQVNEVNNGQLGSVVPVTILPLTNSSMKIIPPSGGYKKGQFYQITVKKGVKSKKGKTMIKNNVMKFSVNGENTAIGKVEISPVLSMFKVVTINATTRPDIKKYKIEGNDNLFNIGEASINIIENKSSVQVYLYGNDGTTLLGKTSLDVGRQISDKILQIQ
ncbi:Ig-like domain-containing protein [Clostridium sp. CX1]|uniref:Ig-like domain-containing protein n=1 Tax=Clostridium sp. CX1 TaxID=2978346 RepID=UPI0021BE2572|nr:Ig-like domain-containing protein [Clostridium sp. CX1]MCT8976116.1 Ig-like domain-containing protein [Clostridium sp. CX1]